MNPLVVLAFVGAAGELPALLHAPLAPSAGGDTCSTILAAALIWPGL